MTNSPDPSLYKNRERLAIEHLERLLTDDRFRIDTTDGRRPVVRLLREVSHSDREIDLKRLMSDMGVFDRSLQARMPLGKRMSVTLLRQHFILFTKTIARIELVCIPPWRMLLAGQVPVPVNRGELESALIQIAGDDRQPTTVIAISGSGFDEDARLLAQRGPGRTLILVEPNDVGGWKVTAPADMPHIATLLDPEVEADKRRRIRSQIEAFQADLLSGGISADRIAESAQLPVDLVEDELQLYAKDAGLTARRLGKNVVVYREGSSPAVAGSLGGSQMPFIQRLKAIFGGKADNEKKIRLLTERRATLTVQRDQAYQEMSVLERKETDLREQFKSTTSTIIKKRITSQILQLHKDLERRQQLMGMLNQQINIVSTHLHNLELVQQGQSAQLPSSEELATDAAAAEEVLAELQASNELAGSMTASAPGGLTDEEQALYSELEKESAAEDATAAAEATPQKATSPRVAAREPEVFEPPIQEPPRKSPGEAEPG